MSTNRKEMQNVLNHINLRYWEIKLILEKNDASDTVLARLNKIRRTLEERALKMHSDDLARLNLDGKIKI